MDNSCSDFHVTYRQSHSVVTLTLGTPTSDSEDARRDLRQTTTCALVHASTTSSINLRGCQH